MCETERHEYSALITVLYGILEDCEPLLSSVCEGGSYIWAFEKISVVFQRGSNPKPILFIGITVIVIAVFLLVTFCGEIPC